MTWLPWRASVTGRLDGPVPGAFGYPSTGSHNFSSSASEGNDDNFVVIWGNHAMAEAYAAACLGTYRH
jgi:hypothetical protein